MSINVARKLSYKNRIKYQERLNLIDALLIELARERKSGGCTFDRASYEASVIAEQIRISRLLAADDRLPIRVTMKKAKKAKKRKGTFLTGSTRRKSDNGMYPLGNAIKRWH